MPARAGHDSPRVIPYQKPDTQYPEKDLTQEIIGCAIRVHKELGPGFMEAIYENALAYDLRKHGMSLERQKPVQIRYDGHPVGEHRADLIVNGKVVVEIKHVDAVVNKHVAQVISTLKAFAIKVGLLINLNEGRLVDGITRVVL